MPLPKLPKRLKKSLSVAEVEVLCDWLRKQQAIGERRMKDYETSDGQGIRWTARDEHSQEFYRERYMREVHYKLVELLAEKK
jgi:hypothetical protein